jgi:hypothetical protein
MMGGVVRREEAVAVHSACGVALEQAGKSGPGVAAERFVAVKHIMPV